MSRFSCPSVSSSTHQNRLSDLTNTTDSLVRIMCDIILQKLHHESHWIKYCLSYIVVFGMHHQFKYLWWSVSKFDRKRLKKNQQLSRYLFNAFNTDFVISHQNLIWFSHCNVFLYFSCPNWWPRNQFGWQYLVRIPQISTP